MYKHLTSEQRYAIYFSIQKGESIRSFANTMGVAPSTFSREIRHNRSPRDKVVKGGRTALYTSDIRRHPIQEEAARRLGMTFLRDFTRGH